MSMLWSPARRFIANSTGSSDHSTARVSNPNARYEAIRMYFLNEFHRSGTLQSLQFCSTITGSWQTSVNGHFRYNVEIWYDEQFRVALPISSSRLTKFWIV